MSSKVNELRQKFANTGGTPAVPPPGGVAAGVVPPPLPAARDRKISAPPVLPSGAGLRPPLPAIPQQKASSSAVRRISSSLDHNNSFLSNNSDENATNDAEDLYLSPDEELKASSQPSPTPIISSKPLPSPKVPPPRKPTSFNFNKSRPQSHSVSEVKVNGGRGGSGDGTFFHSTSNSSLPVNSPKESSSDSLLMFQYYAEEDLVSPLFWEGDNQVEYFIMKLNLCPWFVKSPKLENVYKIKGSCCKKVLVHRFTNKIGKLGGPWNGCRRMPLVCVAHCTVD